MNGESSSSAAQIGQARARMEQVAALEMIRCQKAGDLRGALAWRTLISDQEQTLVDQLAPVWKQEEPQAYQQFRPLPTIGSPVCNRC